VRLDLLIVLGLLATAVTGGGAANAQISDDVVRIGVLNDQSNVYADLGGPGSVIAARMAVEDAGGQVLGKPVDIRVADHQSKADVGASIARQWFDSDKAGFVLCLWASRSASSAAHPNTPAGVKMCASAWRNTLTKKRSTNSGFHRMRC
jgi:ABC-type branched-subunit amino acid transport system substrate-binding protein